MEPFRVAAKQLDVRHLDVDHNLEEHLRLIRAAAEDSCRLVVFPELSVTGHNGSRR
jgi:predicted amidohydrolase